LYVPAVMIELYRLSMKSAISTVEPDVTFNIVVTLCSLSPGFIRSGEYPAKKSLLNTKPEFCSI
jgi:hypothetical protein